MEKIILTPWFYYDVYETEGKNKRIIYKPSPELKKVQRLIMRKYFKPHWEQKGVKETASIHCNRKWLMKLDIKEFFYSITEEQIRNVIKRYTALASITRLTENPQRFGFSSAEFLGGREYSCYTNLGSREVSDVEQIFSICTINGKLPIGAPTSPYIANLILREFDFNLYKFCRQFNVTYSRYMDDLFFSTNGPQYMLSLVELEVLKQFKELEFEVNKEKIKYISGNKLQKVLGLGVNNKKPVLTKETKRNYRAYFYNLIAPVQFSKIKKYKEHEKELLGHLAYIKSVDEEYYVRITIYIFKLLKRLKIEQKSCFKNLLKSINKITKAIKE